MPTHLRSMTLTVVRCTEVQALKTVPRGMDLREEAIGVSRHFCSRRETGVGSTPRGTKGHTTGCVVMMRHQSADRSIRAGLITSLYASVTAKPLHRSTNVECLPWITDCQSTLCVSLLHFLVLLLRDGLTGGNVVLSAQNLCGIGAACPPTHAVAT